MRHMFRLALDHLASDQRDTLGVRSIQERKVEAEEKIGQLEAGTVEEPPAEAPEAPAPQRIEITEMPSSKALDAPLCYQCGSKMQPAGSCYVCGTCGSTSGCS